jgi:glycosyltransferase involved in cell wall biosynthesis
MRPVASVGIPVYNGAAYLPAALASAQEQDLADIEIVISDNGSTDGTQEICLDAARRDARIRYLRSERNRGGAWNYMRVAAVARAPVFAWHAADDVTAPSFVRRCVEALEEHPEAVLAYPRTQLIDATGAVFEDLDDEALGLDARSPHERIRNLLRRQASHVMYGVVRRHALLRTRGMTPCVGDDMVLLTELLVQGPMVLVPEQLFRQRRHDRQFSAQGHEQVTWYAPDAKTRFAFPQSKVSMELVRAIGHAELPPVEKLRCWSEILPSWTLPRWRGVATDLRVALGVPSLGLNR